MKTYLLVAECAIEHKGNFLIIQRPEGKHAGGLLSFVGGKVEQQDEISNTDILKNAARREVFEEVGIKLDGHLEYVTSRYFASSSGVQVVNIVFYCRLNKLPDVIPDKQAVSKYFWMTEEEINRSNRAPEWLKNYVQLIGQK